MKAPPQAAPAPARGGRFLRFPGIAVRPRLRPPLPDGASWGGPSPAGAALRSAAVPGWGQWAARRRRRGLLLLAVAGFAVLVPVAAVLAALYPLLPLLPIALPAGVMTALGAAGEGGLRLLRPLEGLYNKADWLAIGRTLLILNVVACVFRAWAAVDAARCARRRPASPAALRPARPAVTPFGRPDAVLRRLLPVAATAFATVLVLTPHLAFAAGAMAAGPLLAQVLQPQLPAPVASSMPVAEPTPSDPFAAVLPQLPPPDAGRPQWDGRSPLNILLLGTDRRPRDAALGQWGNSDTILLVSVDPQRQQATMISVPRDLQIENIPGVGREKVNAAYRRGGPDLAVRVVGDLLAVPIHRWASIDISAFASMIDAVGGVVVDVEQPIRDDEYPNEDYSVRRILMPAGLQWLDGERALWFARSRHGSTDFARSDRQQRLLLSLKSRARDPAVLPRVPSLIVSLADAVQTDVAPREGLTLASLGVKSDFRSIRGLVLTPPEYGSIINRPDLFAIIPNRERIRRDVAALLASDQALSTPAPGGPAGRTLTDLPIDGGPASDAEPGPGPRSD